MKFSLPPRLLSHPGARRAWRGAAWALALLAAFAAFGFLAAPPLLGYFLEKGASAALRRQVAVERVALNPFALTAEIDGLSVSDDGREVFAFDRLQANLQLSSLLQRGPVLSELRLEGPRLHVVRLPTGRYDVSDLIDEWSRPSEDSGPPRFSVSNIQVSGGRILFDDRLQGARHTVADLTLRLPFISSLPAYSEIFVEPLFSATVNGAPLALAGRSKPFAGTHESELKLDLDRLKLADYLTYLPARLPFTVAGGTLDSELTLLFRQEAGKPATLHLRGALHVDDLVLKDGDAPLLAWKRLDIALRDADLLRPRFALAKVAIAGLAGEARLDRDGRLNWLALVDKMAGGAPENGKRRDKAAAKAPPAWSLDELRLEGASLRFSDDSHPDLATQRIERIDARVLGLSGDLGKALAVEVAGGVNGEGSLRLAGEIQPQPLAASLDVEAASIPLLPAQPYFGEYLNLVLSDGELAARGRLRLESAGGRVGGGFQGQLTVGNVRPGAAIS